MIEFETGSLVQFNGSISSIIAMANGIAKLSNGQEVAYDQLCPVEIGDPLDKQITLVFDNIRYPAGDVKTEKIKYYQDCFLLQGKTIKDVLKENPSINYLHEPWWVHPSRRGSLPVQNWLLKNTEGLRLSYK